MNTPRYIHAGWLIDGSGDPISERVLLTIVGGRLTDIDPFVTSSAPDPALVTDLSHCTILPPFIDSHVHLSMSGTVDKRIRDKQQVAGYPDIQTLISRHIHDLFTHGVLGVRDGGDKNGYALRYKNEYPDRSYPPVIMKVAGRAWHQKGRYGSQLGRYPEENESLFAAFSRENDVSDHVKIINSGLNSLQVFAHETAAQFSLDVMKKTVCLAEKQGKKVMVHANGRVPVQLALEAGCHSIEHGFFMGRENLEQMAANQTVWVPTACTMKACIENINPMDAHLDPVVAEKNLYHQLEQLSEARECGVTVALGTDSGSRGVFHGKAVVEELKLFIQAGYSLPEAVKCGTYNGAKLLDIEDNMGMIARGKPAHFIVAPGTPAQLPRKLSYLEAIYINGIPCRKDLFHKI